MSVPAARLQEIIVALKAIGYDELGASILAVAAVHQSGRQFDWRYRRIATTVGCSVRTVGSRMRKLMREGWFKKAPSWTHGQANRVIIDADRIDAALLGLRFPQTEARTEAQSDTRDRNPVTALPQVETSFITNYSPACGSPPSQGILYQCSDCGCIHLQVFTDPQVTTDLQLTKEPEQPKQAGASVLPRSPSNIGSILKEKYSSKGDDASRSDSLRPKTIDEIFLRGERPQRRKVDPRYAQFVPAEIAWEHSQADYDAVTAFIRQLSEKWYPGTFDDVPVDDALMHGILQGAPVIVIEAIVQDLKGSRYRASDPNRVGTYLRATVWEKARGYQWADLPHKFTRDALRKRRKVKLPRRIPWYATLVVHSVSTNFNGHIR